MITALDTEALLVKRGSFTRIITFISYKCSPPPSTPTPPFFSFSFLCGKNNNRRIIGLLVRLLKHEIERRIRRDGTARDKKNERELVKKKKKDETQKEEMSVTLRERGRPRGR